MDSGSDVATIGLEILIVEDSPTQAEHLRHLLEENRFTVAVASNGKEGLEEAKRRKPTLIISDILMPVMDGYAFCKKVKSDDALKETPVVLLTSLSSPQDVVKGLECGADNFIRKPYDEKYLLARIRYILASRDLRKNEKMHAGVLIKVGGQTHIVTAERQQVLDLLISTYEQAVQINEDLSAREKELAEANQWLGGLYRIAKALNQATSEQQVAEKALERALELPGIQGGWISLKEGESGFRIASARGLPPALQVPGVFEGDCLCRRKLLSGELTQVVNIIECERLQKAKGDTRGLREHASVPLWIGDRTLGTMNLLGPLQGGMSDQRITILNGVGNQIGIALERARLHEHLESLVGERTVALTAEIAERMRAEEAIRTLNEELEQRVIERTAQLEATNKELEAFSYSVSHDLRAPLRAIDGFSRLVLEDHAAHLDAEGQRFLTTIRANTKRMGVLIDDLLAFSRLGRTALQKSIVDMTALAQSVVNDLRQESDRPVEVTIEPLTPALADSSMIRQVFTNLIANAFKFTRHQPHPAVTIACRHEGHEGLYSVEDNGVGFDMQYAHKLFGVFQRLHSQEEFEGTGVGLALVQRIIQRHGGRVWAEGRVNEGATIYFTITRVGKGPDG